MIDDDLPARPRADPPYDPIWESSCCCIAVIACCSLWAAGLALQERCSTSEVAFKARVLIGVGFSAAVVLGCAGCSWVGSKLPARSETEEARALNDDEYISAMLHGAMMYHRMLGRQTANPAPADADLLAVDAAALTADAHRESGSDL